MTLHCIEISAHRLTCAPISALEGCRSARYEALGPSSRVLVGDRIDRSRSEAMTHRAYWSPIGPVASQRRNRRSDVSTGGARVNKNSMMKVGGFIGTLAAGAALVGSAVTG